MVLQFLPRIWIHMEKTKKDTFRITVDIFCTFEIQKKHLYKLQKYIQFNIFVTGWLDIDRFGI